MRADPDATWAALRGLTSGDLALTRVLLGLRTGRVPSGADRTRPLLDRFLRSGFAVLREEPPGLLVLGTTGQPWRLRGAQLRAPADLAGFAAFDEPGAVRIAMSFELSGRTRLATETRVSPTDAQAARTFRRYWALVRPGSDLIRLDVLRAVRRRAERG
ncbi:MAG: hypothetical protein QOG77_1188 [Solirubrobacteraceae bacterium]|nr:hypothetical protein [Solirubrobacteraceae bacterium]